MAFANLLLAELSLSRELYPEALEHLRLSLPHLPPSHPRYDELTSLSASLIRLAPLALTLRHQDSLALHASSPEERAKAQAQTAPTLLGMAQILYGELGESKRAEALYLRIMNDLPKTKERPEAIYRYLLLTLREKQGERAEMLRHRFLSEYPDDPRAKLLAQSDYVSGLEARDALATKLYHEAFTAYRKGQGEEAEARLKQFGELYPDHELRPQALLLGALVRAQRGDNEGFRRQLEQLIRTTPRGDVVELATAMLRKLDGGHRVMGGVLTTPQGLIHPQEQPIRTDSLFTAPQVGELPEVVEAAPRFAVFPGGALGKKMPAVPACFVKHDFWQIYPSSTHSAGYFSTDDRLVRVHFLIIGKTIEVVIEASYGYGSTHAFTFITHISTISAHA